MEGTIKALVEALQPLADKLGEGAAHLYELAVRQAFIDGIVYGTIWLLGAVALAVSTILFFRSKNDDVAEAAGIFIVFGGAIFLIFGTWAGVTAINALANPEYYAIQQLLESVRGE